jgi:endogenous inhibitor of DNA gyrase (YacG/DUF329 family)
MDKKCKQCGKKFKADGTRRQFCSEACRKAFYKAQYHEARKATARTVKCDVCGKEFEVYGKSRKRFCSDECLHKHLVEYNTKYITTRREQDEEYVKKNRQLSRINSRKTYARKKLEFWLSHADAVLKLAEEDNARQLIATYLDVNFQLRAIPRRSSATEIEKEAEEQLNSLGDLRSE